MNKRFVVAGLFCGLACGTATADPVEEYRRACEAPHFEALSVRTHPGDKTAVDWDAAARPCKAFIRRLEAEPEADALARFALYLAKSWLGGYPDEGGRCAEVAEIVDSLPDNDDALFEWSSYCVDDDDERIALLKQLAEMGHPEAQSSLVGLFKHTGDYYGIPHETLARHAAGLYEDARSVADRYRAALAIYKMALDIGDRDAAAAIQGRLVHDHGLDALAYDPAHRGESLARACDSSMFDMDLEERLCLPALEALAAAALARGEAIPDDVLLRVGEAFGESEAKAYFAGGGNDTGARLAAILGPHPETLRSSEHLRVLAETTTPRGSPERVAGPAPRRRGGPRQPPRPLRAGRRAGLDRRGGRRSSGALQGSDGGGAPPVRRRGWAREA